MFHLFFSFLFDSHSPVIVNTFADSSPSQTSHFDDISLDYTCSSTIHLVDAVSGGEMSWELAIV